MAWVSKASRSIAIPGHARPAWYSATAISPSLRSSAVCDYSPARGTGERTRRFRRTGEPARAPTCHHPVPDRPRAPTDAATSACSTVGDMTSFLEPLTWRRRGRRARGDHVPDARGALDELAVAVAAVPREQHATERGGLRGVEAASVCGHGEVRAVADGT